MGAGILPISKYKNTIFFLLGREHYDKKWSDFGGKKINNESNLEIAIREGYEELNGFLGTKNQLKNLVKKNQVLEIEKIDKTYKSYLFTIPYDPNLPIYFNNNHKFIETNFPLSIDNNGFFEKSQIKWFTLKELKSNKYEFRSFYKEIIEEILNEKQFSHFDSE